MASAIHQFGYQHYDSKVCQCLRASNQSSQHIVVLYIVQWNNADRLSGLEIRVGEQPW
jgi:hypothetical protein